MYRTLTTADEIANALEVGAAWAEGVPERQVGQDPRPMRVRDPNSARAYLDSARSLRALAARLRLGEVLPVPCKWDDAAPWTTACAVAKKHGVDPTE